MRLAVSDEFVKFRDPRLNRSGEILPKAVGCGIFDRFSNCDKCRPEEAADVIFGIALDYFSADVAANVWDSRSNNGLLIRLFVRPDTLCAFLCTI